MSGSWRVGDRFVVIDDCLTPKYNGQTGTVTALDGSMSSTGEPWAFTGTLDGGDVDTWKDSEVERIATKSDVLTQIAALYHLPKYDEMNDAERSLAIYKILEEADIL